MYKIGFFDSIFSWIASWVGNHGKDPIPIPYNPHFVSPIPEPETWGLMLLGVGLVALVTYRKNKKQNNSKDRLYGGS